MTTQDIKNWMRANSGVKDSNANRWYFCKHFRLESFTIELFEETSCVEVSIQVYSDHTFAIVKEFYYDDEENVMEDVTKFLMYIANVSTNL